MGGKGVGGCGGGVEVIQRREWVTRSSRDPKD